MHKNLYPITKEGFIPLSIAIVVTVVLMLLDLELLTFFSFVVTLFIAYSFRNPERELLSLEEGAVVAPCDGRVLAIDTLDAGNSFAYRVEIEGSYSDVSLLRAVSDATVTDISLLKGTRMPKSSKLFSDLNESAVITFSDKNENSFQVKHQLKRSFFPLSIDLNVGEKVQHSARYGVANNAITTLYLPANFTLNVSVGQELKAVESLMGYFS